MKRCVIVGGAPIGNCERIRGHFLPEDFFIYCDSGLRHEAGLQRKPDLIIGDFDSHSKPDTLTETIVLPSVKDDTDTMFAVKEALRRGFCEFLFAGVLGARTDHSLANIYLLVLLDEQGKRGTIADDFSLLSIVSKEPAEIEPRWSFFSLLNIDGTARGVSIKNAKYELENAEIACGFQYAVSNETLPGKTAAVSLKEGRLLLVLDY